MAGREGYEAVELRVCKWLLHRGRCAGCKYGLRRAAGGARRRKWRLGAALRGVARRGCRRKWRFAGRDVGGEVALMANGIASR